MELKHSLDDYINKKIESLTKYYTNIVDVRVEILRLTNKSRQGKIYTMVVDLNVPGSVLRAEETGEDLFAIIDQIKDELARRLKKYKNKTSDILREQARKRKRELPFVEE